MQNVAQYKAIVTEATRVKVPALCTYIVPEFLTHENIFHKDSGSKGITERHERRDPFSASVEVITNLPIPTCGSAENSEEAPQKEGFLTPDKTA